MSDEAQPGAPESAPAEVAAPINTDVQPSAQTETTEVPVTSETSGDDTAANEAPAKHKGGFQKRISELTRDKEDAKRERDYWREVALRDKQLAQQDASQTSGPPRQEEFTNYEEYVRAVARHEARQEFEAERKTLTQREQQERAHQARREFEARAEKASAVYADYDEVAGSFLSDPSSPISEAMAQTIVESEKGPDLAYWLASHPGDAARISRLPPIAAARELGRIEASLTPPTRRTVTQAPNPPPTLKGGDVPSKDPSAMSMEEYVAWRAAGGGKAA